MNSKSLLFWCCAAVIAAVLLSSCSRKVAQLAEERGKALAAAQAQLNKVTSENTVHQAELAGLRNELAGVRNELAAARKERDGLLHLRGELDQLREEKQQLVRALMVVGAARPGAPGGVTAGPAAAELAKLCVENLRQIDVAKQQWAAQNGKPADAVPTAQDLAPFLKGGFLPICPAGGAYTLNAVGTNAVCSFPGHGLPQ